MIKQIECEKCGWKWNTKDSKEHDKYVCHKCDHDNSNIYKSLKEDNTKMIKLIDLLNEIENTPEEVYHFTLPKYFVKILQTDKLKSNEEFNGISFTTDPDLWAFREFSDEDQEIGVRLKFKTKDLPVLKEFVYRGHPDDDYEYEKEWISTSGDITNIKSKIKEIVAIDYYKDYLQDNLDPDVFKNIKFV